MKQFLMKDMRVWAFAIPLMAACAVSAVSAKAETSFEPGLFHGVMTITTPGLREEKESWDATTLYAAARAPEMREVSLVWIPYYAWANRGIGEMRVWVHA